MWVLLVFAAMLVTVSLGATVAGAMSRRSLRPRDNVRHIHTPHVFEFGQAFQPLVLAEEERIRWPSEIPRGASAFAPPPWPSESWDDPYFGKKATSAAAAPALGAGWDRPGTVEQAREGAARSEQTRQRNERSEQSRRLSEPSDQSRASSAAKAERNVEPRAEPRSEPRRQPKVESRVEDDFFAAPAPVVSRPSGDRAPNGREIRQMVQELGLAGCVEQIRSQTGWDFRTAANHVAKSLRGN